MAERTTKREEMMDVAMVAHAIGPEGTSLYRGKQYTVPKMLALRLIHSGKALDPSGEVKRVEQRTPSVTNDEYPGGEEVDIDEMQYGKRPAAAAAKK